MIDADLRHHPGRVDVALEDPAEVVEADDALLDAGAAPVVDADHGHPERGGQVHDLVDLLAEHLAERTAVDREVLAEDAHLAPVDGPEAGDDPIGVRPLVVGQTRAPGCGPACPAPGTNPRPAGSRSAPVAVILPLACWRSTAWGGPAWRAASLRRASSSRRSVIGCSDIATRLLRLPAPGRSRLRGRLPGVRVPEPNRRSNRRRAAGRSLMTQRRWPQAAGDGEVVGVGRRPRTGDVAGGLPVWAFSDAGPAGARGLVVARPSGIVPLDPGGLRVSRSLRKSCARFEIRVDTAFDEVIAACADRRRPGAWIDRDISRAYRRLHELGWVHSVEAWDEWGQLGRGALRGGDRRTVRRRVDVPPPDRRLEGGAGRAGRPAPTVLRRPARRTVEASAPRFSTCSGRPLTWSRWGPSRSAGTVTTSCSVRP